MKKRLLKASTLYFIGNMFDKAMAFITVPIFTRMLTTAEYGLVSTYLSWASMLAIIMTLSLGNSVRTAVYDFKEDIDGYISSIVSLSIICAFTISIIASFLMKTLEPDIPIIVIVCICVYAFSNSILSMVQIRYMMEINYIKRTMLQCIPNLAIVILSIFLIMGIKDNKYFGRLYAYAIVTFVFAIFYMTLYYMRGKKIYDYSCWRYALAFSLPLIFHSLSNVILAQADRTMITKIVGADETAIYSIAYQFGMIPLAITTTLENIWIPWFTEKLNKNDKNSVNYYAKKYILFVAIICVVILFVSPEVLKLMTIPEYYRGINIIPPVIIATFFMFLTSISIDLEYYLKKTRIIAMNTLVAALINVALNLLFIPLYGSVAAGYTTVVSYLVSFIMHYMYTKMCEPDLYKFKIYILPIIIMLLTSVSTIILMDYAIIRWGCGCFAVIAYCVANVNIIKQLNLKRLLNKGEEM